MAVPYVSKERDREGYLAWRREYNRRWRRENVEVMRGYRLRGRYGITVADFDAMFEAQNGVCAICEKPETARWMGTDRIRPLGVDHDHATGKVRGLLCHSCNRVLGLLADDPARLRRMLGYLEATS